jgi:hypothetical protein
MEYDDLVLLPLMESVRDDMVVISDIEGGPGINECNASTYCSKSIANFPSTITSDSASLDDPCDGNLYPRYY